MSPCRTCTCSSKSPSEPKTGAGSAPAAARSVRRIDHDVVGRRPRHRGRVSRRHRPLVSPLLVSPLRSSRSLTDALLPRLAGASEGRIMVAAHSTTRNGAVPRGNTPTRLRRLDIICRSSDPPRWGTRRAGLIVCGRRTLPKRFVKVNATAAFPGISGPCHAWIARPGQRMLRHLHAIGRARRRGRADRRRGVRRARLDGPRARACLLLLPSRAIYGSRFST